MVDMMERESGKIETGEGVPSAPIKWEKLFPQIFKRGGEIRSPRGAFKSKAKPKELLKEAKDYRGMFSVIQRDNPELRIVTPGGGVFINGAALDEFMALEDNGLEDLIFAGWKVFIA